MATLYEDKTLFIFGGSAKSKTLNDLYSLDFETVSRNSTRLPKRSVQMQFEF